jgi:hypothetical protein
VALAELVVSTLHHMQAVNNLVCLRILCKFFHLSCSVFYYDITPSGLRSKIPAAIGLHATTTLRM